MTCYHIYSRLMKRDPKSSSTQTVFIIKRTSVDVSVCLLHSKFWGVGFGIHLPLWRDLLPSGKISKKFPMHYCWVLHHVKGSPCERRAESKVWCVLNKACQSSGPFPRSWNIISCHTSMSPPVLPTLHELFHKMEWPPTRFITYEWTHESSPQQKLKIEVLLERQGCLVYK